MTDVIGVARPRVDAPEKVTGQTRYAADGYVHGLLHARLVLATEPHALIERIKGADALDVRASSPCSRQQTCQPRRREPTEPPSRSHGRK